MLLCPWDSPGKNTGVISHFLLQGIFPTQGSNLHPLDWQADTLPLSHQGSPMLLIISPKYRMFVHPPFPNSFVDTLTPNVMVFLGLHEVRVRPHDGVGGCIKRGKSLSLPWAQAQRKGHMKTQKACSLQARRKSPYQTPIMLAPWSETSSLQGDEKPISTIWITQSVYGILLWQPERLTQGWNWKS